MIIRRNADDLRDWVDRANHIYSLLGAKKRGNPPEFVWPSGAIFRTGHLKDENAYTKYQGHEYQRILLEELTQIPSEKSYLRLISSCRSVVKELRPQVFATTNPGGLGHGWVQKRFIDIVPWGKTYTYAIEVNKKKLTRTRVFIQATMDDNPTLMRNDPEYIATIEQLKYTDPELYKAWRFGSWDIFAGQVFKEFSRNKHIIKRLLPKINFPHFLWLDWGYSGKESDEGAFACYAASLVKSKHDGQSFNRVVIYKEWYGKFLNPEEWAEKIYREKPLRFFKGGVADSSMFNPQSDGSTSIADLMQRKWSKLNGRRWITLKRGTRNRVARVATLHNWLSMAPDGLPYLLITEDCNHLIRTIPKLIYDEHNVEDVDTDGEDHPYDSITYGLSAVKFIPAHIGGIGPKPEPRKALPVLIDKLDLTRFEKIPKRGSDWRVI